MYVALFKNLYFLFISKYPEQWSKSLKVGLLKNLHFFHAKLTCCVTTEVPKCCSIRKLHFSHIKLTSRAMIKIYECCTIGILHFAYNSFLQRQQKPLNVALLINYTLEYLKKIYFPYTKLTSSSITRTLFFLSNCNQRELQKSEYSIRPKYCSCYSTFSWKNSLWWQQFTEKIIQFFLSSISCICF